MEKVPDYKKARHNPYDLNTAGSKVSSDRSSTPTKVEKDPYSLDRSRGLGNPHSGHKSPTRR